ncbi:hypothetical protein O6H91_03G123300 [Diphasiastrum complanatum]|uniref:Uncharacterized protein n=1 Tax=Diphasiastrum complanatum TaxID=34168 RepID=A0ACC2EB89_DIPCM|nr:hypothetical protein O6H91_03G123300 [Diphasiastrum complanatum]
MDATDPKLAGDYNDIEMICPLQLGLTCCYPHPDARPTMRYCNQVLHGDAPIPKLASLKPLLFHSMHPLRISAEFESGTTQIWKQIIYSSSSTMTELECTLSFYMIAFSSVAKSKCEDHRLRR